MNDINNKQKRDAKGRFLPMSGKKHYTIKDIEKAFLAGLAAQSALMWQPQSQKLAKYIKENNVT
jgi:hypothetical protein